MVEFFQFWWSCIVEGFTMGGYVFAIAEAACAFMWLFYRAKKNVKAGQRQEDRVNGIARGTFIGLLILSVFLIAPFRKYQAMSEKPSQLKRDALILAEQLDDLAQRWGRDT